MNPEGETLMWFQALLWGALIGSLALGGWWAYRRWEQHVMQKGYLNGHGDGLGLLPEQPQSLAPMLEAGAMYRLDAQVPMSDGAYIAILTRVTGSQSWQRRVFCVSELPPHKFIVLEDGSFHPVS